MADLQKPLIGFNFEVRIRTEGSSAVLCGGAFAECDGLDMNMDVKTIRQGGDNGRQIRLSGPVSYGQVSLKRGMTQGFDLWQWFASTVADPSLRADAEIVLLAHDRGEEAVFHLSRCLPIKLKAPALNARDGIVAVEELQIAFEQLALKPDQH